ncbi:hypothetical protein [Variovorax boronicumulans]|uniref:hypothetical protein n=1 Tax=Variovorax boronicumulans TaxID=436515 RepID=UPI001C56A0D8
MGSFDRSQQAFDVLTTVANALRAETTRGAIRASLWVNETETLADRLDLVIAEIDQAIHPLGEQRAMTLRTLRTARELLARADDSGDIYDTLWLADRTPCTLFDFLAISIEQLEEQRRQRPQAAGGQS